MSTNGLNLQGLTGDTEKSLTAMLKLVNGTGPIQKLNGYYLAMYPLTSSVSTTVALAPLGTYTVPIATTAFLMYTDSPVQVVVTNTSGSFTINVNSLLVLDDTYTSIVLTNTSTTITANVTINGLHS